MGNRIEQAMVVTSQVAIAPGQGVTQLALFNPDGTQYTGGATPITPAPAQADSTATDIAGLVTDFNTLLAGLRTAGLLASE